MCVCNTPAFIQHCNPICSRLKLIKLFVLSACVTRCTNLLDNQQRHDNSLSYREPVWNQQLPLSDRTSTSNESSVCWLHTLKGADNSKLHYIRLLASRERFCMSLPHTKHLWLPGVGRAVFWQVSETRQIELFLFLLLRLAGKGKRCGQWVWTAALGSYQTAKCYSLPAKMGEGRRKNKPFLNRRTSVWFSAVRCLRTNYSCTEAGSYGSCHSMGYRRTRCHSPRAPCYPI